MTTVQWPKLFGNYCGFYMRQLLRQPSYVLSTLVFPSLFFMFFALPNIKSKESAELMLGSFSAFAVIGVVIFQFGVEVSNERASGWWPFQLALPAPAWMKWLSRAATSILFAIVSALLVVVIVHATTDASLGQQKTLWVIAALLAGCIPFSFLGLIIGYSFSGRAALPAANLIYIICSFMGGLWIPPEGLSKTVNDISRYFPTRHFGELVWAAGRLEWSEQFHLYALLIDTVVLLLGFLLVSRLRSNS
jgi:ABC-2 type transport system permease protein